MIFRETPLKDAFVIEIEKIEDERGFFAEGWKKEVAAPYGITVEFNRTNISFNKQRGTLRGLHSQRAPYAEAKLVRCLQGALFDVIVDLRPESPSYLKWFGVTLTAEKHNALYVPCGFLHGFQTLVDQTTAFYQVGGTYRPEAELGFRFDDPAFGIDWPQVSSRILSPKDQDWPLFSAVYADSAC